MTIPNLYRKIKQIFDDSNKALTNREFNNVNNLYEVVDEIAKFNINRLPYFLSGNIIGLFKNDFSGVTSIGVRTFDNYTSLTEVTIGDDVTSIGGWAFNNCNNLTEVIIGNSVTNIGDGAFQSCTSLTSITIPDSVTSISSYAFDNCKSLTEVTIGDGVTSIGSNAFKDCKNIKNVYIKDEAKWCSILFAGVRFRNDSNPLYHGADLYLNGEKVTELIIPDSVTNISKGAFQGCTSLTSVTIPNSVTGIDSYAFYSCSNLTDIYLNPTIPLSLENTDAIPTTTTIHVPIGSGDAYKSATNWSYHSARIVEDIVVE